VRWLIRQTELASAARAAEAALQAATAREVQAILEEACIRHLDPRLLQAGPLPRAGSEATLHR
jgi:hypothetical protein